MFGAHGAWREACLEQEQTNETSRKQRPFWFPTVNEIRTSEAGICSSFQGMPETYASKRRDYPLSNLNDGRRLVRVRCRYCKRLYDYFPRWLFPAYKRVGDCRARTLRTFDTCHWPLRACERRGCSRSIARPRRLVMPDR